MSHERGCRRCTSSSTPGHKSLPVGGCRLTVRSVLLGALLLCLAIPAGASIAVFTDGRTMKIASYKVEDDTIHLGLKDGGKLSLPLQRIDRIVDDEIATPEVVAEVKKIAETGVFPKRSWRYSESSKPLFRTKFDKLIDAAAKHFDVDAALVSAVIKAESDYNPREISNKGARGLMQLMPSTATRFGVTNSFDPEANVYAGTRYLKWLLQTFKGDADLAVAAYNAGEGNVWKYNGVPPFRETLTYIRRIARHFPKTDSEPSVSAVAAGAAR